MTMIVILFARRWGIAVFNRLREAVALTEPLIRSIKRQRSLQKGRHLDSGTQGTGLPQLGQATVLGDVFTCGAVGKSAGDGD